MISNRLASKEDQAAWDTYLNKYSDASPPGPHISQPHPQHKVYPYLLRGLSLDNIFVERLWRSLKHEYIYIKESVSMRDLRLGLTEYLGAFPVCPGS